MSSGRTWGHDPQRTATEQGSRTVIGATALWLLYAWLASAITASWLSDRKGYGERPGLAAGLLLPVVAVIVWLVWPARPGSRWRTQGILPWRIRRG